MAFNRFRPTSHFLAPHSWMNDPCGAVYIPEIQEYIFCYQWSPGTTGGGNGAWGMARSRDLLTWRDCSPALRLGPTYDALGVFSGSIVSRLIEGKRVLFLFYTSVAGLPIHWSLPYLEGCVSQSVAVSTDFGASWHRYEHNPLISIPPKGLKTTGWRDPFVTTSSTLSTLLGLDSETNYMMLASGERGHGSQLHLYQSENLLDWEPLSTVLDVHDGYKISSTSEFRFGKNFECASFFSIGSHDYIIVGVEEDIDSKRHHGRYNLWLSGNFVLENGKPRFNIESHGILDNGVAYAPHIFRDSENRLIQLGWADETASPYIVKSQGWAGCLPHPRELYEITKPIAEFNNGEGDIWRIDQTTKTMTTLGIRPAPQTSKLRTAPPSTNLKALTSLQSTNYEIKATFDNLHGHEKFTFNILQSPNSSEVTKLILDIASNKITLDRSHTSLESLGTTTSDSGSFHLLPNEPLSLHLYVDKSIVEVYVNDRFALTSRLYPTLIDTSINASYHFGDDFAEENVKFEIWTELRKAWPERREDGLGGDVLPEMHPLLKDEQKNSGGVAGARKLDLLAGVNQDVGAGAAAAHSPAHAPAAELRC